MTLAGEVAEADRLLKAISGEMTRQQIQDAVGLKHKEHFRKAYLIPALQGGLIEMTIPDKPRSSKQRYRLTPAGIEKLKQIEGTGNLSNQTEPPLDALGTRLKHHAEKERKEKWNRFSWYGIRKVNQDGTLAKVLAKLTIGDPKNGIGILEAILIFVANPPDNAKSGSMTNATEIKQFDHEKAPPLNRNLLPEIWKLLKEKDLKDVQSGQEK